MKLAASAYPLDALPNWAAYVDKLTAWVEEAAGQGAQLLVFPEYAAMELASLSGSFEEDEPALRAVDALIGQADDLHAALAMRFGVRILAGSAPVYDGRDRPFNRARLFGPDGQRAQQDKRVMTVVEREEMDIARGSWPERFETELGPLGVLTCYDAEFPELGRMLMEKGVDLILAPSYTAAPAGYWRVRIGAQARALEGQCVALHAPCLSDGRAVPSMAVAVGAAGIYGPPDLGFPEDGVLALGGMSQPGWVFAEVPPGALEQVRRAGAVRNLTHWREEFPRGSAGKNLTRSDPFLKTPVEQAI